MAPRQSAVVSGTAYRPTTAERAETCTQHLQHLNGFLLHWLQNQTVNINII